MKWWHNDGRPCSNALPLINKLCSSVPWFWWMSGSGLSLPINPDCSGYVELVTKAITDHQTSKVIRLPFVNLPPRSFYAVYSVLAHVINKRKGSDKRHVSSHLISHCRQKLWTRWPSQPVTVNSHMSCKARRFPSEKISETENFRDRKYLKRKIPCITFHVDTAWFELKYVALHVYCGLKSPNSVEHVSWIV